MTLRATLVREVQGETVALALPLARLRVLAAHEPKLYALFARLSASDEGDMAALDDIVAVLDAACAGRGAWLVEAAGLVGARALAIQILYLALSDDVDQPPGKAPAAAEAAPTRPSASAPTS